MYATQLLLGGLAALTLQLSLASPLERRTSLPSSTDTKHLRPVLERRDSPGFAQGQPYDGKAKAHFLSVWATSPD